MRIVMGGFLLVVGIVIGLLAIVSMIMSAIHFDLSRFIFSLLVLYTATGSCWVGTLISRFPDA